MNKILTITLFLVFLNPLFCQRYNVVNFGVNDGLTSSNVNYLCQDNIGYIWFATQNGICRYDGRQIREIKIDPNVLSVDASFIMTDSKNRVWIATTNFGAYYIEAGIVHNFTVKDGLPDNWVNSIFEDSKGNIWFATDQGSAYFDQKGVHSFIDKDSILSTVVYCVSETADQTMWFGTVYDGLIGIKNNSVVHYSQDSHGISNTIYSLTPVGKNLIIGSSESGAYYLENNKIFRFNDPNLNFAWISKSILTQSGVDFITSSGLIRYNSKDSSYISIRDVNGLVSNDLYSGFYDNVGNLWLSSGDNGVSVLLREDIRSFNENTGLASNRISCLSQFNEDIIVGTSNQGLSILKDETDSIRNFSNDFLNDQVNVLFSPKGKPNELWIGGGQYSEGIIVLMKSAEGFRLERVIRDINGVNINSITKIEESKDGKIYIATYGAGVFIIEGKDTLRLSENDILLANDLLDLHIDQSQKIWLSMYNLGVFLLEGDHLRDINGEFGLKELNIECIAETKNGDILLGNKTEGLTIISKNLEKHKVHKTELLSNHITEIEIGENGEVWVGTDKGVNRIFIDEELNISGIISITRSSGIIGTEVIKSGLIVRAGKLWVATSEGLSCVNISDIDQKREESSIVLTGVRLFFEQVDWEKKNDSKINDYGQPTEINLPYYENHLTFDFSTLSISGQKFSFKLEGWDNDWSPYSENNSAVYSNLQPGEYVFKVNSIDNFETPSSNVLEIKVVILPPFWSTWWFRTVTVLVLLSFIYLLFRLRTRALKRRQKELEFTVEERTREVVQEKMEVERQKHLVEEKNQEISDSINYAERIQRSMLANKGLMDKYFSEYFVFFQPKDVVSGDFYWASELEKNKIVIVNADSTGHGVPGAIMSMLNMNSLKESVDKGLVEPHDILNETRRIIKETLKNDGSEEGGKDGMDCSLLLFEKGSEELIFAAANNPVWIVRGNELIEFKGDKMPVGKHDRDNESFTMQQFTLEKGDVIYTLTDGMPDQFGGPKGKKYMYKQLKELLSSISTLSMDAQKLKISDELNNWMGKEEQVDDVCIIGIRVS